MTKEQLRRIEIDANIKINKIRKDLVRARSQFVEQNKEFEIGERVRLYSKHQSKTKESKFVGEGFVDGYTYVYNEASKEGRIRYIVRKMKLDQSPSKLFWERYQFSEVRKS